MKERELLDCIIADDANAFSQFVTPCRYRYGRFPVLSLLYLYKSKRILSKCKNELEECTSYTELDEPFEVCAKFTKAAGKCLRLYKNTTVTPIEMLLLLGRFGKCNALYKKYKPTDDVVQRLDSIYYIRYQKRLVFGENGITFPRRPLTYRQKRLMSIIIPSAAAVVLAVAALFIVNAFVPFLWDTSRETLNKIDFASEESFVLEADVTLPDDFYIEKVNCTLDGNGHTVRVKDGTVHFGTLYGAFKNVKFVTNGTPVFDTVYVGGEVTDCGMEVRLDRSATAGFAPLAVRNYGSIKNVTATVRGSLRAEYEAGVTEDGGLMSAGLVYSNAQGYIGFNQYHGTIADCTVSFDLSLSGQLEANASFGGIVALNRGEVTGCTTSGRLTSDTFDIAGICVENNSYLVSNVNNADISVSTANGRWNPLATGIVMTNNYAVQKCVNNGGITCLSTGVADSAEVNVMASAAGIAMNNKYAIELCENNGRVSSRQTGVSELAGYRNTAAASGICINAYGYVYQSKNAGEVRAESPYDVFIGGIAAEGYSELVKCVQTGTLIASGETCYVGGILGFSITAAVGGQVAYGTVSSCVSEGGISARHTADAYIGGIVGYVQEREFSYIGSENTFVRGGVINGCFFTGAIADMPGARTGAIAGAVGKAIYDGNEFEGGKAHFKDNAYAASGLRAIGVTVSYDGDGKLVTATGSDLGAEQRTPEQIKASEAYIAIVTPAEQ